MESDKYGPNRWLAIGVEVVLGLLFAYAFLPAGFVDRVAAPAAFSAVDGANPGNSQAIAWLLYRQYLMPFEIVSVFLLQHAEFLAGVQIFVYGGGIMVLFLFVIMLVNLQGLRESSRYLEQLPWAAILVVLAVTTFGMVVAGADFGGVVEAAPTVVEGRELGNSQTVGWYLYRDFLLPFEVASVFLLVAMIGAVVLGRRQ
jgi:NADH-quinone oxidoreductase subunit J